MMFSQCPGLATHPPVTSAQHRAGGLNPHDAIGAPKPARSTRCAGAGRRGPDDRRRLSRPFPAMCQRRTSQAHRAPGGGGSEVLARRSAVPAARAALTRSSIRRGCTGDCSPPPASTDTGAASIIQMSRPRRWQPNSRMAGRSGYGKLARAACLRSARPRRRRKDAAPRTAEAEIARRGWSMHLKRGAGDSVTRPAAARECSAAARGPAGRAAAQAGRRSTADGRSARTARCMRNARPTAPRPGGSTLERRVRVRWARAVLRQQLARPSARASARSHRAG